ncbi:MAG TPA: heme-binding protein [Candidatus Competibacteraceae bacterium]|nr:heme-binding protein [Candidatus Competibacteraceae bacterium]
MRQKTVMSLAQARQIVQAAAAEAAGNRWPVVIAVVDDGGHLVCLERLDGAQFGSIETAIAKARAAAAFRRPTKVWSDRLLDGQIGYLTMPGVLGLEGGLPLTLDGEVVGAIGVSGVTSGEDAQVARAGVAALAPMAA